MSKEIDVDRPEVLFLAHRIPFPPNKGDKIRSFRELKALTGCARVTLACFLDDPADEAHVPALREQVEELIVVRLDRRRAKLRSLLALASTTPLSLAFYRSRELAARLAGRRFDAVVAFSSTVAPYALRVTAARRVLDLCDLDSEKWAQYAGASRFPLSLVYRIEARRLGAYEATAAARCDTTLLVSEAEAETLRSRAPGADVRAVPNGVDLEFLDPGPFGDVACDGHTAVFCGAMDYKSNVDAVVWFHDEILPRVRREVPDARFRIVGMNPAPEVVRLGETEGVEVTGSVPDVRPEILRAGVSVAPLRLGRGVPNKILEALALSLPVVTTSNGTAGLRLGEFEAADVADDPATFAAAVVRRMQAGQHRFPQHRESLARLYRWELLDEQMREAIRPVETPVG